LRLSCDRGFERSAVRETPGDDYVGVLRKWLDKVYQEVQNTKKNLAND
jgi:hypothetical protein